MILANLSGRPFQQQLIAAAALRRRLRSPLELPTGALARTLSIGWGCLILLLRPQLIRNFESGREPSDRHQRAALHALTALYRRGNRLDRLAALHVTFWSGQAAVRFHADTAHRFDSVFRQRHYAIVDELQRAMAESGVHQLCEIGCGSGQILSHLASRLPGLQRLVGLDLSAEQVAINRARNADPRVEYHATDAVDWIAAQAEPGWAWLSYGGVFEFLAQPRLVALLALCAARSPAVIALVEPLEDDYDADAESLSVRFGQELTSSHPYPRLLSEAGFRVSWRHENRAMGFRWLMLIACR